MSVESSQPPSTVEITTASVEGPYECANCGRPAAGKYCSRCNSHEIHNPYTPAIAGIIAAKRQAAGIARPN